MIIIEGLDGTGKTTLANDLLNKNYILINNNLTSESHYDKYVNIIKTSDINSVSDRSFVSEMVYGKVLSGTTKLSEEEFINLVKLYSEYETKIIYLYASKKILLERRKDDFKDSKVIFHLYQKLMDEFERRLDYISAYIDVFSINTGEKNCKQALAKIIK
jgi:thymidylate kinase